MNVWREIRQTTIYQETHEFHQGLIEPYYLFKAQIIKIIIKSLCIFASLKSEIKSNIFTARFEVKVKFESTCYFVFFSIKKVLWKE